MSVPRLIEFLRSSFQGGIAGGWDQQVLLIELTVKAAEMIELEASSGIWRLREAGARTWSSESRKAKVREEEGGGGGGGKVLFLGGEESG